MRIRDRILHSIDELRFAQRILPKPTWNQCNAGDHSAEVVGRCNGLILFGSMVANTLHRGAFDAGYEVGGDHYIALRGLRWLINIGKAQIGAG